MNKLIIPIIVIILLVLVVVGIFIYNQDTITFDFDDNLADGNGVRARVVLLGGQSNASDCSRDDYLKMNVDPEKYAEYENGYDNVYINYIVGPKSSNGFVKCSVRQGEMDNCFGPELGLAEKLSETYPDETIFIIKCAWGGSDLYNMWLSPSSFGKTGELYKQFISFVDASIEYLVSKNYDVKIEGMCWMQGESDSFSAENGKKYEKYLKNFIKDVRCKFNVYASDDGIAFVDAYIADNPMYWVYCDLVNSSKKAVVDSSEMNVLVDTIAHGLTCSNEPEESPDMAHYDSLSEIKLGHLFAAEVIRFFD